MEWISLDLEMALIIGQEKSKLSILLIFYKMIVLEIYLITETIIQTKILKRMYLIGSFLIFKFLQLQVTFWIIMPYPPHVFLKLSNLWRIILNGKICQLVEIQIYRKIPKWELINCEHLKESNGLLRMLLHLHMENQILFQMTN